MRIFRKPVTFRPTINVHTYYQTFKYCKDINFCETLIFAIFLNGIEKYFHRKINEKIRIFFEKKSDQLFEIKNWKNHSRFFVCERYEPSLEEKPYESCRLNNMFLSLTWSSESRISRGVSGDLIKCVYLHNKTRGQRIPTIEIAPPYLLDKFPHWRERSVIEIWHE